MEKSLSPMGRSRLAMTVDQLTKLSEILGDVASEAFWRTEREQYLPPIEIAPAPRKLNESDARNMQHSGSQVVPDRKFQ